MAKKFRLGHASYFIIQPVFQLHKAQDKPFDQTFIKDIAQAAGVNHGLLHYYFKSKEDILIHYSAGFRK